MLWTGSGWMGDAASRIYPESGVQNDFASASAAGATGAAGGGGDWEI